jgi:hypothetical protein
MAQQLALLGDNIPVICRPQASSSSSPSSSSSSSSQLWFLTKPELNITFIARFIVYVIEALFHIKSWEKLIQLGVSFNALTQNAYGEMVLKFMVYAQQEVCGFKLVLMERKSAELTRLEADYRMQQALIVDRKNARRSQRGKREEDSKMESLKKQYEDNRLPIEEQLEKLTQEFQKEDDLLTQFTADASHAVHEKPRSLKALEAARYRLMRFYSPMPEASDSVGSSRSFRSEQYSKIRQKRTGFESTRSMDSLDSSNDPLRMKSSTRSSRSGRLSSLRSLFCCASASLS